MAFPRMNNISFWGAQMCHLSRCCLITASVSDYLTYGFATMLHNNISRSYKAHSMYGICKNTVHSWNESRLKGEEFPDMNWRATSTKDRFTNLINFPSVVRESLTHTPLKGHVNHYTPLPRQGWNSQYGYASIDKMLQGKQGPKVFNGGTFGTSGWNQNPKVLEHGALVVGKFYSTAEAEQAISLKKVNLNLSEEISKLKSTDKIIQLIAHPDTQLYCSKQIKSNPGKMTAGVDQITVDAISVKSLHDVANKLKMGKYQFIPAGRDWIPKPGKTELRPLGIADEQIIQKAFSVVLEQIYEPTFSKHSHGFRPGRGCHSALLQLKQQFQNCTWVIQADITKCFDNFDHSVLLNILKKKIHCKITLKTIHRMVKAGYINMGKVTENKITGSESVLSLLLCNIYQNELDQFMEKLMAQYNIKKTASENNQYARIWRNMNAAFQAGDLMLRKKLRKVLHTVPRYDPKDPEFLGVRYVRYMDDFVIGVIGPRSFVVQVKEQVELFLREKLQLDLNKSNTKITHLGTGIVSFLGVHIRQPNHNENKLIVTKMIAGKLQKSSIHLNLILNAPQKKIIKGLVRKKFLKWTKSGRLRSTSVARVVNWDHSNIVKYYNAVIWGLWNYYSFANNKSGLGYLVQLQKASCALTLARKHKVIGRRKIYRRFGSNLMDPQTKVYLNIPHDLFKNTFEFKTSDPEFGLNFQQQM